MGLENPARKTLDREQFLAKAESLYTRVIDHVWKDLQAKEKDEKQDLEADFRIKLKEQPPPRISRGTSLTLGCKRSSTLSTLPRRRPLAVHRQPVARPAVAAPAAAALLAAAARTKPAPSP